MRIVNLFMAAITLLLPFMLVGGQQPADVGQWLTLGVLVLTTILTTYSGYLINDYFDWEIDKINKPERSLAIGENRNGLKKAYFFLFRVVAVLCLVLYFPLHQRYLYWVLWYIPLAAILLYWYSKWWKCSPFLGNLLVALLCAAVPFMLYLADLGGIRTYQSAATVVIFRYVIFAFLSTLYREIVKDMEDIKGDAACNCHTLPVLAGLRFSKMVASSVALLLIGSVMWYAYALQNRVWQLVAIVSLVLPFGLSLFLLWKATKSDDFHSLSVFIKIMMLIGLFVVLLGV